MAHKIRKDERRHQDYLRRKGLKTAHVYESRLLRLRAHEVKRVLDICAQYDNPAGWPGLIESHLDESSYFQVRLNEPGPSGRAH